MPLVAGILAFRRIGQEQIDARAQAALLEDRAQHLIRGPGPGRRFEDDELAGPQMRRDRRRGPGHEPQVRLALARQWRRHADQQGITVPRRGEIRRRTKPAAGDDPLDPARGDVADVALAPVELLDLRGVDVESHHLVAGIAEGDGQRQPDIAEADDADLRLAAHKALAKAGREIVIVFVLSGHRTAARCHPASSHASGQAIKQAAGRHVNSQAADNRRAARRCRAAVRARHRPGQHAAGNTVGLALRHPCRRWGGFEESPGGGRPALRRAGVFSALPPRRQC